MLLFKLSLTANLQIAKGLSLLLTRTANEHFFRILATFRRRCASTPLLLLFNWKILKLKDWKSALKLYFI